MLSADAYQKMPVARAITVMELDRIDVHTHLAGEPVTICTVEGISYRLPEKMQPMARKAFEASARGFAPDVEKGKLHEVLRAMAGEEEDVEKHTLASVAAALADRLLGEFDAAFRDALLTKLKDRRDSVLQGVLVTLLE